MAEGPSWLPEAVRSVALRLARVEELIYTVGEACFSWSKAGPLQLVQHRSQGGLALTVASIRPIPPIVGLHISESINHLRAALDNVVFYMVADRRALGVALVGVVGPVPRRPKHCICLAIRWSRLRSSTSTRGTRPRTARCRPCGRTIGT